MQTLLLVVSVRPSIGSADVTLVLTPLQAASEVGHRQQQRFSW